MRRRRLIAGALALVGGAAVAVLLLRAPEPFAFRWPAGAVYTYRVELEVEGTVALVGPAAAQAQSPLSAALALEAEVALRSYGRLGDTGDHVLGARLTKLERLDWTLAKQPLLPDGGRGLVGREVVLVVAADGTFRRLNVAADAPPALANLFRQLLAPLEVVVAPRGRSWTRQHTNPLGEVRAAYEARAARSGTLALERRPVRYTRLAAGPLVGAEADAAGRFDIVLSRAGHLDRLAGQEQVAARRDGQQSLSQTATIDARLLSITHVTPEVEAARRLLGLVSSGLGDSSAAPGADWQARESRIAGLTMERLVEDLFLHGSAKEFPDVGRWMWRATGLLRLYPERCRDLVAVFKSEKMTARSRGRVLDLLGGTGHAEAQNVLRELLETPEARAEDYPLLLQRLSLLDHPTPETVAFLRTKVERGDGDYTLAAAHSLGSALGKQSRAAGGEVDERAAALLRQGLAAARSPREKADWVGALGNAGLERDTPLLAGFAADEDPSVRASVAVALRKTQTPASEKLLLELAADEDGYVQGRALNTLARYQLAPDHFEALRQQVAGGQVAADSYGLLVTLLERNRSQPRAVLPVVEAVLARGISDQRLLMRVRALRGALASGS